MAEHDTNPLRLLGLKEVAEILGTHWHNVRDLVETGDLPCVRVGAGREPKVARITLEAWLRRLGEAGADLALLSNPLSNPASLRRPHPTRKTPSFNGTPARRAAPK